jgi:pimeloyl-ACP methyl ester carboxylesterase
MAPEIKTVQLADERQIACRFWSGRGRPLVLLHGLLDSAEGWDALAKTSKRPCYAFDLPGFGDSSRPKRASIKAYAEDIAEAIDDFGIKDYLLVGHSLGGAVAVSLAEMHQQRTRSMTLLAPAGFGHIRLAEALSLPGLRNAARLVTPLVLANPILVSTGYSTMVAHDKNPSPDLVRRIARRAFDSAPGVKMATQAIAKSGQSKYAFYKREVDYQGPVSAVWGDHDHLVPLNHIKGLKKSLPQTKVSVWKDMGHHPQWEKPARLEKFIIETCSQSQR